MHLSSATTIVERVQEIFPQVLFITDFKGNKDLFTERFIQISLTKASMVIINKLTVEQQNQLKEAQTLLKNPTQRQMLEIVQKVSGLTEQEIESTILENINTELDEYVETVSSTLTSTQKAELEAYLKTI